jgi:hypothetical protein
VGTTTRYTEHGGLGGRAGGRGNGTAGGAALSHGFKLAQGRPNARHKSRRSQCSEARRARSVIVQLDEGIITVSQSGIQLPK